MINILWYLFVKYIKKNHKKQDNYANQFDKNDVASDYFVLIIILLIIMLMFKVF